MNAHRRHVPARVREVQELRRSGAAGAHSDRRREAGRKGCRGNGKRAALREQAW